MQINKHIILIGFMCSGKTTFGKQLALHLNMPFIDIDDYISQQQDKTVAQIFAEQGEEYFRELERAALTELLKGTPSIISSGGGTPCFHNNIDIMNRSAITVYLACDTQTVIDRLKMAKQERPLLKGKTDKELFNYVDSLLNQRKPIYQQAHVTLSALNPKINELINTIEHLPN